MSYFPLRDFDEQAADIRTTVIGGEGLEIYDRTIASISRERVRALQDKYRNNLVNFDQTGIYKYADLPFWIGHKVALSRRLGLDLKAPMKLLDIGMGAGHFAAVAQGLGHTVVGTDISVPLYDDIAAALDLDRRIVPVVRGEPYPDVGGPFDRIAIVWQVFDYIRTREDGLRDYWPLDDWKLLLGDLARNHSQPGAIIHLELNPHIQGGDSFFDQELLDYCARHGGDMAMSDLGIVDLPVAGLLAAG